MIVVSDTTPLTYLVQIEQVSLLERLYKKIVIPSAVHQELLRFGPTKNSIKELFLADWISIQKPTLLLDLPHLIALGAGEREALSLAVEIKADLVLMD